MAGFDGGKGVGSFTEGNGIGSNLRVFCISWRKALLNTVSFSEAPAIVG